MKFRKAWYSGMLSWELAAAAAAAEAAAAVSETRHARMLTDVTAKA
jgi:hypothetical protein